MVQDARRQRRPLHAAGAAVDLGKRCTLKVIFLAAHSYSTAARGAGAAEENTPGSEQRCCTPACTHSATCIHTRLVLLLRCLPQVLLTMSRHHKLEQPLQQLLKKAVQQACEDEAAAGSGVSSSRWMAALPAVGSGPSLQELEQGLLKAVRWGAADFDCDHGSS